MGALASDKHTDSEPNAASQLTAVQEEEGEGCVEVVTQKHQDAPRRACQHKTLQLRQQALSGKNRCKGAAGYLLGDL